MVDLKRVTVAVHKPDLCKLRVRLAAGVTVTVPDLCKLRLRLAAGVTVTVLSLLVTVTVPALLES